jgi:hypothetical protein
VRRDKTAAAAVLSLYRTVSGDMSAFNFIYALLLPEGQTGAAS